MRRLLLLLVLLCAPLLAKPPYAILPGKGVGPFTVGDWPIQVGEKCVAEGITTAHLTTDEGLRWSFPKQGPEQFGLIFIKAGDFCPLTQVAVYSPKYSVKGQPTLKVSCSRETVLKAFPDPSGDASGFLDYNQRGIYFYFNSRGSRNLPIYGPGLCEAIIVYKPGTSRWAKK